jgi:hypothetical protein
MSNSTLRVLYNKKNHHREHRDTQSKTEINITSVPLCALCGKNISILKNSKSRR